MTEITDSNPNGGTALVYIKGVSRFGHLGVLEET
jgi:hypothetical protein